MHVEEIQPGVQVARGVTIYTVISPPQTGVFLAEGPDGEETTLEVGEVLRSTPRVVDADE